MEATQNVEMWVVCGVRE